MIRRKYPPKNKKTNKPRNPPIQKLSDADRQIKVEQEYQKAMILLGQSEKAATCEIPDLCIHGAYYAMIHCARAVILKTGGMSKSGDVPNTHRPVIERFSKLVASEPGDFGKLGMTLFVAFEGREAADYTTGFVTSPKQATAAAAEARKFITLCANKWGLELPAAE
jgi:uncharacterized protein (UPF0332 family)